MRTGATSNDNGSSHGGGGDERTLADLVDDIARLEATFAGWEPEQQAGVAAYKGAIEALHAVFPLRPCDFVFEPAPDLAVGLGCVFAQVRTCAAP
ncbi:MAG: hypothetical protein ACREBE_11565, partial [bacterium]